MNCLLFGNTNKDLFDLLSSIQREMGCEVESLISDGNFDAALLRAIASREPQLVIFCNIDEPTLEIIRKLRTDGDLPAVTMAIFEENPEFGFDQLISSGIDDVILPPLTRYGIEIRLRFASHRALQRSDRNKIRDELRRSQANAMAIVDTSVDGIITIDEQSYIRSYNRAAEQIFGYEKEEVIGKNVNMLMPAPYHEEHDGYVKSYHETGHKKIIGIGREVKGLRKNGEIFPMELAVTEIEDSYDRMYTGIIRDISDRRLLEIELLKVGEEERRRIGQDIHDGLGQMLTGIGLIAQNLARGLKSKDRKEADDMFELVDLIKDADQQARTIARTLLPIELEHGGLKAAALRLGSNLQKLYGMQCIFEESGEIPALHADVQTHFFRIIQEAMGNAAKHSKANRVSVALVGNKEQVRARIEDNGIGINVADANGRGMGLRIMQHRANVIGATLDVRKGSDHGTIVTCTLPLTHQPNALN